MRTAVIALVALSLLAACVHEEVVPHQAMFANEAACASMCQTQGLTGTCAWPSEPAASGTNAGPCVIANTKHCGNEGQCNCYCQRTEISYDGVIQRVPEDTLEKCGAFTFQHLDMLFGIDSTNLNLSDFVGKDVKVIGTLREDPNHTCATAIVAREISILGPQ